MSRTARTATTPDRKSRGNSQAEDKAIRHIIDKRVRGWDRRAWNQGEARQDEDADIWQQVEVAAYLIDSVTLSPKARVRRDDQGQVLDGGRPEPLLHIVTQTLVHLQDAFAEGQAWENWQARTTRQLLTALVAAMGRIEREGGSRKKKQRGRRGRRR